MIVMQGKGVSTGVMKGPLYFFQRQDTTVIRTHVEDISAEKERLAQAQEKAMAQLEALAETIWHSFLFGPVLLDEQSKALDDFSDSNVQRVNPRSVLGYYEPGHYCFVVVDGRQTGYSRGIEIDAFAQLFADLGCVRAYNMDGGASATMTYNDAVYNKPCSGGRDLGDILLIRELEDVGEVQE